MTDRVGSRVEPLRAAQPCVECGRPSSRASYPFCSARCRAIDLNRWLTGAYAIPATGEDGDFPGGEGGEPGDDPG